MGNRINPNSKEMIKEALDIIKNTEDDEAAVAFLSDTLSDNFPDLDLGRMDLHEAIEVLGGEEVEENNAVGNREKIENLNDSLSQFMDTIKKKDSKVKKSGKKSNRRRRRRRRKRK